MNFISPNHVYFLKGTIDMDLAVITDIISVQVSSMPLIPQPDDRMFGLFNKPVNNQKCVSM